jgi:hypothetical protein
MNGDGYADVGLATTTGLAVLRGGPEGLAESAAGFVVGPGVWVGGGDMNGDGLYDVARLPIDGGEATVFCGAPDLAVQPCRRLLLPSPTTVAHSAIALEPRFRMRDVDQDGLADVVGAAETTSTAVRFVVFPGSAKDERQRPRFELAWTIANGLSETHSIAWDVLMDAQGGTLWLADRPFARELNHVAFRPASGFEQPHRVQGVQDPGTTAREALWFPGDVNGDGLADLAVLAIDDTNGFGNVELELGSTAGFGAAERVYGWPFNNRSDAGAPSWSFSPTRK